MIKKEKLPGVPGGGIPVIDLGKESVSPQIQIQPNIPSVSVQTQSESIQVQPEIQQSVNLQNNVISNRAESVLDMLENEFCNTKNEPTTVEIKIKDRTSKWGIMPITYGRSALLAGVLDGLNISDVSDIDIPNLLGNVEKIKGVFELARALISATVISIDGVPIIELVNGKNAKKNIPLIPTNLPDIYNPPPPYDVQCFEFLYDFFGKNKNVSLVMILLQKYSELYGNDFSDFFQRMS